MAKLSKDEWLDIRSLWEADPKLTFGYLAAKYGLTKQTISSRSKKEGWERRGNLVSITRAAQKKADEKTDELSRLKGDDAAIDLRVDILCKHRGEILTLDGMQDSAKVLFDAALKTKKKEDFWLAKIAIDCVKDHIIAASKKQTMERKCWGLDEFDISPADVASLTNEELSHYVKTHKLPLRLRKIFRSFSDEIGWKKRINLRTRISSALGNEPIHIPDQEGK